MIFNGPPFRNNLLKDILDNNVAQFKTLVCNMPMPEYAFRSKRCLRVLSKMKVTLLKLNFLSQSVGFSNVYSVEALLYTYTVDNT